MAVGLTLPWDLALPERGGWGGGGGRTGEKRKHATTTAVNHWALHHPGGKLTRARCRCVGVLKRQIHGQGPEGRPPVKPRDVAAAAFCVHKKIQVLVLSPDVVTGESGPTDKRGERLLTGSAPPPPMGDGEGAAEGAGEEVGTPSSDTEVSSVEKLVVE